MNQIKKGFLTSWDEVHAIYREQSREYAGKKLTHALSIYSALHGIDLSNNKNCLLSLLEQSIGFREELTKLIIASRKKDYQNPFRQMVYENTAELEEVIGKLSTNNFILEEQKDFRNYKKMVASLLKK